MTPPGNLDDLAGRPSRHGFLDRWNRWIETQIREEIRNLKHPQGPDRIPDPLFFTEADSPAQSADLPVTWNGYPLAVSRQTAQDPPAGWAWLDELGDTDRYTPDGSDPVATQFRRHDEYCEWRRDDNGSRGPRMIFTAEGPEYWILLAEHDLERVVGLYQELVSLDVRESDLLLETDLQYTSDWLLPAGTYDHLAINYFLFGAEAPGLELGGVSVTGAAADPAPIRGLICPAFAHIRKSIPAIFPPISAARR